MTTSTKIIDPCPHPKRAAEIECVRFRPGDAPGCIEVETHRADGTAIEVRKFSGQRAAIEATNFVREIAAWVSADCARGRAS